MSTRSFTWVIGGEAGYGIAASGKMFTKTLTRMGYHAFATSEFPSLIRGGNNTYQARISERPVNAHTNLIDILVAMNHETIELYLHEMAIGSIILYDAAFTPKLSRENVTFIPLPLTQTVRELKAPLVMRNAVAVGASIGLIGADLPTLQKLVEEQFSRKGKEIVRINREAIKRGYHFATTEKKQFHVHVKKRNKKPKYFAEGNDAFSVGAIESGLKFVAEYPMTPSSSIMNFLAAHETKFDIVVQQAEDEIAALNMVLGASYAGARSLTATSGGGFSLMTEALGLAGMAELPCVIINVQRPGPSTGLPTMTEQSDLRFALHASQGEFPRIVLTPGDHEEMYRTGLNSLNYAEKYQMPVIVLSDKYLSESAVTFDAFRKNGFHIHRGSLLTTHQMSRFRNKNFKRFEFTKSGISNRAIPGHPFGMHKVTGNEHDENGLISEDSEVRTQMMEKRMRKLDRAMKEIPTFKLHGKGKDFLITSWGSTKGAILEVMDILKHHDIKCTFIQFTAFSPFNAGKVEKIVGNFDHILNIEMNQTAQAASILREKTGHGISKSILKFNGHPFSVPELHHELMRFFEEMHR